LRRSARNDDAGSMTDILKPRDAKDVEAAVQSALAQGKALEVMGAGSKRRIGRPSQTDFTLDLSALAGVTLYEPEELVLSARAGTPLAEIEALTAAKGQELAFEPMDYGPLLGGPAGAGTIGGVLAANLSGPRRIKAGAARDHFLGLRAVSGRGESFKSGGRVVKNVTGYDLCKLLAGSWGTLAAMTEVTVKTLPKAAGEETVLVLGLDAASAVAAMVTAMRSACDVSGAAHLPANVAVRVAVVAGAGTAVTALRLEGVAPSVAHRKHMLQALLKPYGALGELAEASDPRCDTVCSRALGARAPALAHLDGAGPRSRSWRRNRRRIGCGAAIRLGGRPRLGSITPARGRRRPPRSRRGRRQRRPRHPHSRAALAARIARCV
jgi:glycolate oxidase FAD binding subunit